MRIRFTIYIIALSLTGCVNTYSPDMPSAAEKHSPPYSEVVYVTNPEHVQYSLLKKSRIYRFSDTAENSAHLTILDSEKIHPYPACGMSFFATIYSLGLIPNTHRQSVGLRYSLENNNETEIYTHRFAYTSTLSSIPGIITYPFRYSKERAQAKALRYSKRISVENEGL